MKIETYHLNQWKIRLTLLIRNAFAKYCAPSGWIVVQRRVNVVSVCYGMKTDHPNEWKNDLTLLIFNAFAKYFISSVLILLPSRFSVVSVCV
jgi:hypothetical protein